MTRIVVFTADYSHSVRAIIAETSGLVADARWLVLVQAPRKSLLTLARNQWRNVQRNGWRWIPYQLRDGLRLLRRERPAGAPACAPGAEWSEESIALRPGVRIERIEDLHSDATLATVRAFRPVLGLSIAAPILRRALFEIPRLGTLNLHKGKLPEYRGMPPAFWELWNGESRIGCSVHKIDAGLDTGDLVCETAVLREHHSTLRGLQLQLDSIGIDLVARAVSQVLAGATSAVPQIGRGNTYRKPTLAQIASLERRLIGERPAAASPTRELAKEVFFACGLAAHVGVRRCVAPRVVVLLYHRVSDDVRDNLTVGIAQFDRQMALLRRHCDVIDLHDLLKDERIQPSKRPLICVTFDDGYLDNFTNAVPILMRHRIPAAFFVSTGLIGTDRSFPHDVRRGNRRPPTMRWEDVEKMQERGFTIGSHSMTHIDCAKEPEAVVRDELEGSARELRTKLGSRELFFAYPYGGRENMTPQRLEVVKGAGYAACLSAYGGANVGVVDRYNVLRCAINWAFSDRAFRFRCLGLS